MYLTVCTNQTWNRKTHNSWEIYKCRWIYFPFSLSLKIYHLSFTRKDRMFEKYRFICCKRYTSKPYSILDVSLAKRNGFIVFTGFSDYTREMIIHVMVVFISFLSSLYKDCVKVVGDNIQPLRCIFFIYCTALVI